MNFHKSLLVGVNIHQSWVKEAVGVLKYKLGGAPFKYMGLEIYGNNRREWVWNLVIDAVKNRSTSWNNRLLSIDGQIVLLNFVLFPLLVYFFSFFKAATGVISKLDSLLKKLL